MKNQKLQWHPGFQAAIQIELLEDQQYLQFEKEYNLTEKPLMVDTLIIKLEKGHQIRKSIGRMCQKRKSPVCHSRQTGSLLVQLHDQHS